MASEFKTFETEKTVWKKLVDRNHQYYIAECIIPAGTRCYINKSKTSRHGRKCRAAKLIPIAFYKPFSSHYVYGDTDLTYYDKSSINHRGLAGGASPLTYTLGKEVKPSKTFSTSYAICASGIHFFMSYKDAMKV